MTTQKLKPTERTRIIAESLKGIEDPNYEVVQTKSGYMVRKRKSTSIQAPPEDKQSLPPSGHVESVSNDELLRKLADMLIQSNAKIDTEIEPDKVDLKRAQNQEVIDKIEKTVASSPRPPQVIRKHVFRLF